MKAIVEYLYSLNFELDVSKVVSFLNLQIIINVYQNSDIILAIAKFQVLKAMLLQLKIQAFFAAIISKRCNKLCCFIQMPPPDLCIAIHAVA